jgi:uncharacterized protein (DUF362 family)
MDRTVKVAVVRGESRRGAVAQALALIGDDFRRRVAPRVLVKPNLVSHHYQLPSTHRDTFGATLDALFSGGVEQVTVAEGATDATTGFERFGLAREADGLPVRFLDLNREETRWDDLRLTSAQGTLLTARVSRTVAESPARVSLAVAKTHVTSGVTLSLKNMLSSIHPDDRVMMHGHAAGGNGYTGWRRLAVEFLKRDNLVVNVLTRALGRVRNARTAFRQASTKGDPFEALTPSERNYLRSVDVMHRNLVALARKTLPDVAVVDGFLGMHREGPRHGTPIRLGTVIAGTDAVAVDAVAAAVMGFEPRSIGFLVYAHEAGLGEIDLDRITVVGDTIAAVRRRFVPHSNHVVQRHWQRLSTPSPDLRGPHFAPARDGVHQP